MLTGGEPLLHSNLWALCDRLRERGHPHHAGHDRLLIAQHVDDDRRRTSTSSSSRSTAPPDVHDEHPPGARRLRSHRARPCACCATTRRARARSRARWCSDATHAGWCRRSRRFEAAGVDRLSFLAADVSSTAFNRPEPWTDRAARRNRAVARPTAAARRGDPRSRGAHAATASPRISRRRRRSRCGASTITTAALAGLRRVPGGALQRAVGIGGARSRKAAAPVLLSPAHMRRARTGARRVAQRTAAIAFRRALRRQAERHLSPLRVHAVAAVSATRVIEAIRTGRSLRRAVWSASWASRAHARAARASRDATSRLSQHARQWPRRAARGSPGRHRTARATVPVAD